MHGVLKPRSIFACRETLMVVRGISLYYLALALLFSFALSISICKLICRMRSVRFQCRTT